MNNEYFIRAYDILHTGSRLEIVEWLQRNDANGCWNDEACKAEGWPPMTYTEAFLALRDILDEGF